MTDAEHYLNQAEALMRIADEAPSQEEREQYVRMAGAYVQLAKEAASFEATHERPLEAIEAR